MKPAVPPKAPVIVKGLKKALLVGINYKNTPYQLYGCINDVEAMRSHIKSVYPTCNQIISLTDNGPVMPSKRVILNNINWLVSGLKPGENVLFHYSGHGGQVRDTNGDEVTGMDSCIYPFDGKRMEMITDDELRIQLANKIPAGSKCFIVLDSCHSGTAVDLRYKYTVSSPDSVAYAEDKKYQKTTGQVVFLSGCRDTQYSMDTVRPDGVPCGAMTWALIETWKKYGQTMKLKYLLWDLLQFLKERNYEQVPQMTLGQYMDINQVFDLTQ